MLTVGLIAFGVGVLVGYVSLRSLGWLVVLLCLSVGRVQATITFDIYGPPNHNVSLTYYSNGSYPTYVGDTDGSGHFHVVNPDNSWNGPMWACVDTCTNCWFSIGNVQNGGSYSGGCNGYGPTPTYYMSVCWTNTSNFPARAHIAYSDGTSDTSALLPPNGVFCVQKTNTVFFQWQLCDVIYGDGQQFVNCGGVQNPGTNSYPGLGGSGQGSYVGGGVAPNNPIGPGAGAGSNTNLTGGQFANGTSNIINQIYGSGNAQAAQLAALGDLMRTNNAYQAVLVDDYGRLIDTNGQLVSITMSGNSNVVSEVKRGNSNVVDEVKQTGSNTVSAVNQQGTNVANATGVGSSNIVNALSLMSTNPGSGGSDSNSLAYLRAISNNTYQATGEGVSNNATVKVGGDPMTSAGRGTIVSNILATLRANWEQVWGTNSGQVFEGTNVAPAISDSDFWTIPGVYSNTAHTGYLRIPVRETSFWGQICPWLRLIGMFIVSIFATRYVHWRIQETMCDYLGRAPGGGPVESATSWLGFTLGLETVATVFAVGPVILASAIGAVSGFSGGTVTNPLSVLGAGQAGVYESAVRVGVNLLGDIFPYVYSVSVMTYLFVFDATVAAFIIAAQRALRFFSK